MSLNASQQAVVDSEHARRMVLAGPGSGKTKTVVEVVAKAVREVQTVVLLTFTNAGAKEFTDRLGDLGKELAYAGNVHGYCLRLIQTYGHLIGYRPPVGVLAEADREDKLVETMNTLGYTMSRKALMAANDLRSEFVWTDYAFTLKSDNLVDFDTILSSGVALLNHAKVESRIKVDLLVVDEVQDSAMIDWRIYNLIPAARKCFFGDMDQNLYAFRGASGFTTEADTQVLRLEENYRSDFIICDRANRLIEHNVNRLPKKIVPISEEGGDIFVTVYETSQLELSAVSIKASSLFFRQTVAILCRQNETARTFSRYLEGCGSPLERSVEPPYPPSWKRAMLLLSLCLGYNEATAVQLLKLDHSAAEVEREKLTAKAEKRELRALPGSTPTSLASVPRFLRMMGVDGYLVAAIERRIELLPQAEPTFSDLICDLNANAREARIETQGIYVGTIHSAKGREFDVVFLPAFEQGIIPSGKANADIEEERRVAFVGITRARHAVYFSHARVRTNQWGATSEQKPSQFLEEMGL